MTTITDHPLLVFALALLIQSISAWIGAAILGRRRPLASGMYEDIGVVQNATLTLLALIIGFSFSMAVSRYDLRKSYEEAEANAIGTEYVRAGLLPTPDATSVQTLLVGYLDQRVLFYDTRDPQQLRRVNAQTAKLQNELWAAVQTPAVKQPTAVTALAVAGMNDALNSAAYTQAAWWNRIPQAAWGLMAAIAICANLLLGFGARAAKDTLLLLAFPLIVSIAFLLIADIDSPRGGLIRVQPQNLLSLSESLHTQ
jgi:hypothetical protein